MRPAGLYALLLLFCGCSWQPIYYAPPAQFTMPPGNDPVTEVRLVTMNHPAAPFSILDGVLDPGHGWGFKWTLDHSNFRLIAGDLTGTDLFIRYALDPTTLRDRGPIRITIAINRQTFNSFVESTLGEHVRRWPADSIKPRDVQILDLSLTVDPPWISQDGNRLGVFLDAIGFVPRT